jgi:flagellar protein FliL
MSVVDIAKPAEATGEEVASGGGGKRKLILVLLVLTLMAGAGYWFLLAPAGGAEKAPEPGAVVKLDAIQVNLADDHYLKVGIALQASKDAGEEIDGSKALDETIDLFSGQSMDDLARRAFRDKMKQSLEHRLDEAYEGEVIGVYFTDFVSQ